MESMERRSLSPVVGDYAWLHPADKGTEALKHKIRVIINKCREVLFLSGGVRISQASQDRLLLCSGKGHGKLRGRADLSRLPAEVV